MTTLSDIDNKILELLKERTQYSVSEFDYQISSIDEILKKADEYRLNPTYIAGLFTLINNESIRMFEQKSLESKNNLWCRKYKKASYLGPKGTYSFQAMVKFCEKYQFRPEEVCCSSFNELVSNVKQGISDLSFLPVENTSSGIINEVYDLLRDNGVHIIGEITLPINHSILVNDVNNAAKIDTFYSHPQPIIQSSNFLKLHYPDAKFVYCDSTADAVKKVKNLNQENIAAIASEFAGTLFGLSPIRSNIANQSENFTRFIVIAKDPITVPTDLASKISITFTTNNTPGALAAVLDIFKQHQYNLTKLASRPIIGRPWEELFYADFIANLETVDAQNAIHELKSLCHLNILGCYPLEKE
ncbi:MAG: bifunctional chorismate mutase/prephenate dehydratase [Succinivibrionaceae bacterium]|jgi:chorismate mutase/prephenate dehydratase|nr:bifunctional chorismate mutase/prephenate dehydratase [Succinivibrionaceae bacterium]